MLAPTIAILMPMCDALVANFGTHAHKVPARAIAPVLDFGSFEKSFMDDLYRDERVEKNKRYTTWIWMRFQP